jgi:hypothetical protein
MMMDEGLIRRNLQSAAGSVHRHGGTSADEVILVNANDAQIGTMPKHEAHRRGLSHRAISIIVSDRPARILLQQRVAGIMPCVLKTGKTTPMTVNPIG